MIKVNLKINGKAISKEIQDNTLLSDFIRNNLSLTGKVIKNERVEILNSNFLNNYFYTIIGIVILLLVVIFYFVSR